LQTVFGRNAWLDVGARVRGPELKRLKRAFKAAFKGDLLQSPFQTRNSLLFFNSSILLRRTMKHDQVLRLRRARHRIWLQTPYFVPIRPVYRHMVRLAKRGVDVRLMVPAISDVPLMKTLSYSFFRKLLKAGVKIFEYQPRFMHQKISQIDHWVAIGSSNLNHRSFFHDLEVDVVIAESSNKKTLEEKFLLEQRDSRQVVLADLSKLKLWNRLLGRFLLMLRYWS
jgi:cardiolipin synthase